MMCFAWILAILAITAVIVLRVSMLRRINDAAKKNERPFDYEDEYRDPYTGK